MALAIATLCFCPPEMWDPFTPTLRSNPLPVSPSSSSRIFSSPMMNDSALAFRAASVMSLSVTYSRLYLILSLKEPANRAGSWLTTPKLFLK